MSYAQTPWCASMGLYTSMYATYKLTGMNHEGPGAVYIGDNNANDDTEVTAAQLYKLC